MNSALGKSMLIVWAELGITIENIKEDPEHLVIYISVPESSYKTNVDGIELSGSFLAKRFKQTFIDMGAKRLTVKSRTRTGEVWSKEKAELAAIQMKKHLFGSQY